MLEREDPAPLPPLALGFALFGGASGFFAVLAFGALNYGSRLVHPGIAAVSAAVAGGLFGALLRSSRAMRNPFIARENVRIRLLLALSFSGALAGLATAAITVTISPNAAEGRTLASSTIGGLFVGASLLPAASAVFTAALRASRARTGSVVSRADRARVRLTLFATASLLALAGLPAVAIDATSEFLGPAPQLLLSLAVPLVCLAIVVVSTLSTWRAERELAELSKKRETCAPAEVADSTSSALTDLGLGDERWSEVRVGHAYRGSRDASVVLRGNLDDARAAILDARRNALRSVAFAVSATLAVGVLGGLAWLGSGRQVDLAATDADPSAPASLRAARPVWVDYHRARIDDFASFDDPNPRTDRGVTHGGVVSLDELYPERSTDRANGGRPTIEERR